MCVCVCVFERRVCVQKINHRGTLRQILVCLQLISEARNQYPNAEYMSLKLVSETHYEILRLRLNLSTKHRCMLMIFTRVR